MARTQMAAGRRANTRRFGFLMALGFVTFAAAPSAASAGAVSAGGPALFYSDPCYETLGDAPYCNPEATSEQNDVSVTYDSPSQTYTLTDAGATITDGDGAGGCSVVTNVATCPVSAPGPGQDNRISFYLGAGDDQLTVQSARPNVDVRVHAGDGSDLVDLRQLATPSVGTIRGDQDGPDPGDGTTIPSEIAGDGDDVIYAPAGPAPPPTGPTYRLVGGAGADRLYGGPGDDDLADATTGNILYKGMDSGAGDADLLDGAAGSDRFNSSEGPDTMIGGGGDDRFDHFTIGFGSTSGLGGDDGAVDSITCGSGDDEAAIYAADAVTADCETAWVRATCPKTAPQPCETTIAATAPPPPVSQTAQVLRSAAVLVTSTSPWGEQARTRRHRIQLAPTRRAKVKPGKGKIVPLEFIRRRVNRALKGRSKVRARVNVGRRAGSKRLSRQRTPFTLKKR